MPDLDEKVDMITLQQGTTNVYFKMSLAKNAPQDMNQLQERTGKCIKDEESMRKPNSQFDNEKKTCFKRLRSLKTQPRESLGQNSQNM